jgi:hypothetical protein
MRKGMLLASPSSTGIVLDDGPVRPYGANKGKKGSAPCQSLFAKSVRIDRSRPSLA